MSTVHDNVPSIPRLLLVLVAILGASGVGIGAYAAHGLQTSLEKQNIDQASIVKRVDRAETGVRYHMFHTLAILVLACTTYVQRSRAVKVAIALFAVGIALFSGVLYLIAIVDSTLHWLVPFGGLAFIAGWVSLGISAITIREYRN